MAREELTDEEFAVIAPLLPPERSGKRGHPYQSHRQVLNGIFWVLRTGAPWRDVPERYGPWSTAWDRFRRWRNDGTWQRIVDALQAQARKRGLVEFDFSAMDGSVVRAHKHAAGAKKGALRPKRARNGRP
jgi:transposase